MTFFYKSIFLILILCALFTQNISTYASIIDDLKNGFDQSKNNIKEKVNQIKNKAQTEQDQIKDEAKKICEIQKGYATKHFENRQLERSKEIEEKIGKINKIKVLLTNNKQDISSLSVIVENLTKLLKQKTELLNSRVQNANLINCVDENQSIRSKLVETNQNLSKLDKEIRSQTREFSSEVQRLIIKMKEPKVEEAK